MRKKITIAAVILLVLAALVGFAVLNLGRLVKSNKDYILTQAEQALGRKVAVEDIGVTVWGGIGIRLKNFALADDRAFSRKDALRASDLQVNVEFFPLLWKEVRVKRLVLRKPVIRVIRNKKGKLNFASLGGPPPKKAKVKKTPPSGAPPGAAAALPLLVSRVKVADGEIHYLDRKDGVDLRVRKIDLTVKDVGLDQPVSIKLAAAINADHQNLKVKGKIGPLPPTLDVSAVPVEGEIEISRLDIDDLQRILPQIKKRLPKGLGLSGPLQAKTRVSGSAQSLTLAGVELTAAVFGARKPNLQFSGRVGPLGKSAKDLSLKGDVTLGPVALANLKRFAPLAGTLPKDLSAHGPLSLDAHVDGTLEKFVLKSKVEATASAIRYGNQFRKPKGVPFVISTDARVTPKKIALQKANIKLHTMQLTSTGAMTRGKTPAVRLTLDSSRGELAGWEKILPMLGGYNLAGGLKVHARIQGAMSTEKMPNINGSLTLSKVQATLGPEALANLRRFAPLAGVLPPGLSAEGPLSLDAHVDGTLEKFALKSKVEATASAIRYGNQFRKPKGVPFVISTDARVTPKKIALQKANIKLHTMQLTGTGAMTRGKTPAVRLTLDSSRAELAGWEKILPILQPYKLSGGLEAHTRIQGKMKKGRVPDINGSLKFTELKAVLPQLPQPVTAKSATVTFTGQRAALAETPLRVGKSEMRLTANIERLAPLALTYRLSSPEIWLADVSKGTGSSKKPEVLRTVNDNGRVWEEKGSLSYRGQFSSAQGRIADIDYTQLQARLSLAGQVATIDSLKLRAYNGTLQGKGRYDFHKTPPRFTLTSQFRDMDVSQLFRSTSATASKQIRGGANLDLNLAGSGNQWQDIQRTLTGRGQAEVLKGALLDVNIAEGALTGLTGVPGLSVFISPNTRKKYPSIFETKNTEFDHLKGSVNIRGGKVHLDDLLIAAADWAAVGKGWVTLDQTVRLQAQLVLSQQLSTDLTRDVKLLKYLRDRQGRLTIPFTLAGTLPRVAPKPDVDHVARLVQRGLVGQGIEELTKGLFKQRPPQSQQAPQQKQESLTPPKTTQPPKKKPEEELLKGLKELFGR